MLVLGVHAGDSYFLSAEGCDLEGFERAEKSKLSLELPCGDHFDLDLEFRSGEAGNDH